MLFASWTSPAPIEGTLQFKRDPKLYGLGTYEDVDGKRWDVRMITSDYICARQIAHHPNYYSTAAYPSSSQGDWPIHKWKPYLVEVVTGRAAKLRTRAGRVDA
jgi:hypothetical protein